MEDRKTLNISRYSSRRLYNTGAGEYVKVDDLAKYIRDGHDIKVTDKKTGEDITGQILLQIIADQEAESGSVLPTNILTDIIRNYSSDNKSIVPKFLSESFEVLKDHRKKLSSSLLEQVSNPLDPSKAINSFEALRDAQTDIAKSVLSAWLPKSKKDSSDNDVEESSDENEISMSEKLEELNKQMQEMKKTIDDLKR